MILPFRRPFKFKPTTLEQKQDILARAVMDVFPNRPAADFIYAIRAGNYSLASGAAFMDAMVAAEEMFNILEANKEIERAWLTQSRNRIRLNSYCIKRLSAKGE